MNTCHGMNIIVQTTVGDASYQNGKSESPNILLIISQELFYWTKVTRNKFGALRISTPYYSPVKLRIDYALMFLTSSGMEQDIHTNTSKYGVWESTSSMDFSQRRSLMIDHIEVISWGMQLLQDSLSTGIHINHLLSTEPIMFSLMNIITVSKYKTSILLVIYYFNKILKGMFIIQTSSTLFHVGLVLHTLHFVIQQLSHIKLIYIPLEIEFVFIY